MPLILAVIASVRGVGADDGILLTVNYAATPGGVALTWTGGSPVFEVYRSANPALVVAASNKLGETNDSSWTDVPPPGGVHYYQVVLRINHPPTISPIGNQTAPLGQTLTFQVSATDPDGDPVTRTVTPLPLPAHATFDGTTGQFSFHPTADQVGTVNLTFIASDGSLTASESVTITIPAAQPGATASLSGRLLDANAFEDGFTTPIVNATVSLLGTGRSALSDSQGNFLVTNVPPGHQVLDIATGTALGGPYGGFREAIEIIAGVENHVDRPFFLPLIDATGAMTVNPNATTVVNNTNLGVTLTVPPHTAKNENGSDFTGTLSISIVPHGLAPAALPKFLDPALVVTIQPVGVAFATPVPLTFPNTDQVPAGNDMHLWSLLATEGRFAVVGRGAVSANGQSINTVAGGVRAADWHFFIPPQPMASGPLSERRCGQAPDGPEESQCVGSSAGLMEGALQERHALPGVRSMGISRTLTLAYDSTTADVRPIVGLDTILSQLAAVPQQFSLSFEIGNVTQGATAYYNSSALPENADSSSRLVAQFDGSSLPTGRYTYSADVFSRYSSSRIGVIVSDKIVLVNHRLSTVGTGWSFAGLQRLYPQPDGSALIEDGTGSGLLFEPSAQGAFTATAMMNSRRGDNPFAAPLPDGRVLLAGGTTTTTSDFASATTSAEIFDPVGGAWTPTGSMHVGRVGRPEAVVLNDGRILIAGGGSNVLTNTAEIYDSATGLFTFTGSMSVARNGTATRLGNGTVLVAGGQGLASAEVYDPVAGNFSSTNGPMTQQRFDHTATLLPDGRVLLAGGHANCALPTTNTIEIYDPATKLFTSAGVMTTARAAHTATLLPDGRVLFTGGSPTNACVPTGQVDTAEIFDPVTGTSTLLPDRLCSIKSQHSALALPDGRVLIAGGWNTNGENATACADLYDPTAQAIIHLPLMTAARGEFPMVGLPDGRVLLAGGGTMAGALVLQSAEIFGLSTQAGAFVTPAAEFSVLTKNMDGTYLRHYKDGTEVHFDASGLETSVADRNGNTTAYSYGPQSRLASMTDPKSQVWNLSYDGSGLLQTITDPASRTTSLTHDARGDLIRITKTDGTSVSYTYDSQHRLRRKTDERGNDVVYAYDFAGRLVSASHPNGEVRQVQPTAVQGLVNFATGIGTVGNPAPIVLTGNVVAGLTDGNGHSGNATLNRFGSATRLEDALNRETQTVRDANNLPTQVTRPNGSVVTMTYDTRGNLLTSTEQDDPNGPATTTFTYEPVFNQVTSIKDARNHTTLVDHDVQGNPTTITDARMKDTILTWLPGGLLETVKDPIGNTTTFAYDTHGNLSSITDPRLKITTITYDPAGNVDTTTDPLMHLTQYDHDPQNRLTEVIGAALGHTQYAYDLKGNLSTLTDAKNQITRFTYDAVDQITKITNALNQARMFSYDLARNLTLSIDAKGQKIESTYDSADQLTGKVLKDSGGSVTDTVAFTYDQLGNLATASDGDSSLTFNYDPLGRLSTAVTAGTQPATTISYTYDKNGNRVSMTDPQTGITSYIYDELNRLSSLTSPAGVFAFGYDDASRRTSLDFPNGTSAAYAYNPGSLLTSLMNLNPASVLLSKFDYTYDDTGNRDTRTTLEGLTTYTYDALDRLTGSVGPDPANPAQTATESYAYDAVGNRTSSHLATGQVLDAANRLLEDSLFTFVYDPNGSVTQKTVKATSEITTYSYDVERHLISVTGTGGSTTYTYDPLGRRISKSVNGSVTRYVYDLEDILEEYDSGAPLVRYTHGDGIDEPLARTDLVLNQTICYEADGLGSIVGTTDNAGSSVTLRRYDSFGNLGASLTQSGYAFTGREWDPEAGLYYYRAREYEPKIGRFLTEDPIGFRAGINYYAYVDGDPIGHLDPAGLLSQAQCRAARILLIREKYLGTRQAARMSSITFGDGLIGPFNSSDVPPIQTPQGPLEIDWYTDVIGTNATRLPGLAPIWYSMGKTSWTFIRLWTGNPIGNYLPFEDYGESIAVLFILEGKQYRDIFDAQFLARECPPLCGGR